MHDQQNIVFAVSCIALLSAVLFTVAQALFGWYAPHPWVNTLLLVLWVLVVLALFQAFQALTTRRKEAVRRFYLSPEWVYNHEIGYAPLSKIVKETPYDFVMFAGNALAKMAYGFDVADAPENFQPTLLISSKRFTFHFIDDSGDPADRGVVVDKWTGSLDKVQTAPDGSRTYIQLGEYANATDLAMLLDANGAFNLQYNGGNPAQEPEGSAR